MNDKFHEQKDTLISIKKEISLLHQQVDYLIRHEKPLELLDLDVMMNRTHTLYDLMCGVEVVGSEEEELPKEMDNTLRTMFGIEEEPIAEEEPVVEEEPIEEEPIEEEEPVVEEEPIEEEEPIAEEEPLGEEEPFEENEEAYFVEEVEDPAEEPIVKEEPATEEEPIEEKNNTSDDFGFILNFEPVEPSTEASSVYTTGDEIEMSIPSIEFPEDNAPEEQPEEQPEEPSEETLSVPNFQDNDFEVETLGDRLQQEHDPTLADKLQHSTVKSLLSAIGINDKFLFVNELFNGSMEKYNRSIENLDDLKTLNGALIYLNELRIELQWNSSNEAYQKLLELVHRKFEA